MVPVASIKYFDQATGTYKYVLGGMTQDSADARYLTSGFRNVIRNGDMSVAQRGNGPWTLSGVYTADGVRTGASGGTVTYTRVPQPVGPAYLQTAISGQSAAGDLAVLNFMIEDVATLGGQTVTLSFLGKVSSGTAKIGIETDHVFGGGGSTELLTAFGTVALDTTMSRKTFTFVMPSMAGKTTGSSHWVVLNFWLSAGSNHDVRSSSVGIQNNTFSVTDVQLEAGSAATAFERLPVQQQMAWCQRYFQRYYPIDAQGRYCMAMGVNTTDAQAVLPFIAPFRANPSWGPTAAGTFSYYDGAASGVVTQIWVGESSGHARVINLKFAGGMSSARCIHLMATAGQTSYIDLSAEF